MPIAVASCVAAGELKTLEALSVKPKNRIVWEMSKEHMKESLKNDHIISNMTQAYGRKSMNMKHLCINLRNVLSNSIFSSVKISDLYCSFKYDAVREKSRISLNNVMDFPIRWDGKGRNVEALQK